MNHLTEELDKNRNDNDYIHWNIYNVKLSFGCGDVTFNPVVGNFTNQTEKYCDLKNALLNNIDDIEIKKKFQNYANHINLYFSDVKVNPDNMILSLEILKELDIDKKMNIWTIYCLIKSYGLFCVTPDKNLYNADNFGIEKVQIGKYLESKPSNKIRIKFMNLANKVVEFFKEKEELKVIDEVMKIKDNKNVRNTTNCGVLCYVGIVIFGMVILTVNRDPYRYY